MRTRSTLLCTALACCCLLGSMLAFGGNDFPGTVKVTVYGADGRLLSGVTIVAHGQGGFTEKAVLGPDGNLYLKGLGDKLAMDVEHPEIGNQTVEVALPQSPSAAVAIHWDGAILTAEATGGGTTPDKLGRVTTKAEAAPVGPTTTEYMASVPAGGTYELLQGGDTCATATVIASLPYAVTGTTVGYVNDYDGYDGLGCPYTGSTAPDVVYKYTPAANETVDITLCVNTAYDSKLYVFQGTCGTLYACNDDSCSTPSYPSAYVSDLSGVALTGGVDYYIVVDGYGSSSGTYTLDITGYVPPEDNCPPGSLYSQTYHLPDEAWSFGTSEVNATGNNYLRAESFSGVTSPICDLHWWGIQAYNPGTGWTSCTEPDPTFEVKFYLDAGGVPGAVVQTYTVVPTITPTGIIYAGLFEMNYYSVALLNPCVNLAAGWVSIQGFGSTTCWFLWASSPVGNGSSYFTINGTPSAYAYDNAFCLTGEYVPTFGACCDDSDGSCEDNIELINCPPPLRFVADTLCDSIVPPCGQIVGACCYPDGTCAITTQAGCVGGDWLGPNTTCAQCPCIVPCPPGSYMEQEVCGDDTNGGCNSSPPAFEVIDCGDTVCGTIWTNTSLRDTDWYEVVTTQSMIFTWAGEAEFPVVIGLIEQITPGVPGCGNITGYLNPYALGAECQAVSITTACFPAGTYYFFVSHQDWPDFPCGSGNDYAMTLTCTPCEVPTGACCFEDGSCTPDMTETDCVVAGGEWQGPDTVCDPNPCPLPEPGDNCALPLTVTLPAQLPYADNNQYTCGRNNDYADTCLGYYDGGEDMIYELVVTAPVDIQITMDPLGTTYTGIALDDSCPPDLTCIAMSTHYDATPHDLSCTHLEPGTYYIMVDTWPAPDCIPAFNLAITTCTVPVGRCCYEPWPNCVDGITETDCQSMYGGTWTAGIDCTTTCPEPGYGDDCDSPYVVNLPADLPFSLADSTCGRVNDYADTCMGSYDGGEDMLFEIVVTEPVCVTFTLDANDIWAGMGLDDLCPLGATGCIATAATSADPDVINQITLPAGVYYLMVDTWPSPDCVDFTLAIDPCPPQPGACCIGADCFIMTEPECTAQDGVFLGEGTDCGGQAYVLTDCTSAFEDISGTGTALTLGDDSGQVVPIGFTFNFYAAPKTQIGVCSNGYLTFGTTLTSYSNVAIPNTAVPNDMIAPFWDDLNPGAGGTVHYQTLGSSPNQRFIAQWTNVPQYGTGDSNTFQAVLYEGSDCIEFRYGVFTPEAPAGDYTIGIENADGTDGVAVDPSTLSEGSCVSFCPEQLENPCMLLPHLDMYPGSCPNRLAWSVVYNWPAPAAICGTADFDVTGINAATLQLSRKDGLGSSLAPSSTGYDDVATPFTGTGFCKCHALDGDGYTDLTMAFGATDIATAFGLDETYNGNMLEVKATGLMLDGTPFTAEDCLLCWKLGEGEVGGVTVVPPIAPLPPFWTGFEPADLWLNKGGDGSFTQQYEIGAAITMSAPAEVRGRQLIRWEITDQFGVQRLYEGTSIQILVNGNMTVRTVYQEQGRTGPRQKPTQGGAVERVHVTP